MTAWFISDLHLEPKYENITAGFMAFLEKPQSGDQLYILGDFFNIWIGDDFTNPYIDQIKQALKQKSDQGIEIFFMHGNRDFLIGQQFCKEAGCTLLDDPTVIELFGERYLLMHGDSLCTRDVEYMQVRAMLRTPQWQQQFLSQSIQGRIEFAQNARAESQSKNAEKASTDMMEDIMDVTPEEVVNALKQHGVTKMIHGHTHRPARHQIDLDGTPAERIVLGDWHESGWQLKIDEAGVELSDFDL